MGQNTGKVCVTTNLQACQPHRKLQVRIAGRHACSTVGSLPYTKAIVSCSVCFRQPTAVEPCLYVLQCPLQTATSLTDQHHRLPFLLTGQTGATPVPAQSLYPSSHQTVLSQFRYLVHNHPHNPCHAKSGRFSFHAAAEPVRRSLSVLPCPQRLDVVPSTWASVSVEVLQLQYSFTTSNLRLGVSCIVPDTDCPSTARNTMQAPVSTLL